MWKLGALFLVWIVMRGHYAAYVDLVRAPAGDAAGEEAGDQAGKIIKGHANDNGGAEAPSDEKSDDKIAPKGQTLWDWIFRPQQVTPENAGQ